MLKTVEGHEALLGEKSGEPRSTRWRRAARVRRRTGCRCSSRPPSSPRCLPLPLLRCPLILKSLLLLLKCLLLKLFLKCLLLKLFLKCLLRRRHPQQTT